MSWPWQNYFHSQLSDSSQFSLQFCLELALMAYEIELDFRPCLHKDVVCRCRLVIVCDNKGMKLYDVLFMVRGKTLGHCCFLP